MHRHYCPQVDPPSPFHAACLFPAWSLLVRLFLPTHPSSLFSFLPALFQSSCTLPFSLWKSLFRKLGTESTLLITSQPSLHSCSSYCLSLRIPSTSAFLRVPCMCLPCQRIIDCQVLGGSDLIVVLLWVPPELCALPKEVKGQ